MQTTTKTFADFGVPAEICEGLEANGITHPFPIQELTLPLSLPGSDLIGQARTGTGKTLAFGVPLLARIDESAKTTQALIVVPTRELALQVREDLAAAAQATAIEVLVVYGGRPIEPQIEALAKGAQVVVGTPGRLLDLMNRGALDLSAVKGMVLDEADEMLDLGFLPDVERIIEATNTDRQTLLFSATMPSAVVGLARRYMTKPTFLRAESEEPQVAPETAQHFFSCHRMDKPAVVARILTSPNRGRCVIFSRTKRMADQLAADLQARGIAAAPIHSDLRQEARERALARFRTGETDVLVATEVAARGLDITDVTHVINYDCPDDEKMYLHRIGRTGRAGAAGVAITFATWNEAARLEMIKRALGVDSPTHEVFSTSPILTELFDLPAETGGGARIITPRGPKGDETHTPARGGRGGASRSGDRSRKPERTKAPEPAVEPMSAATEAAAEPARASASVDGADDDRATGGGPRRRSRRRTGRGRGAGEERAPSPRRADAPTPDDGDSGKQAADPAQAADAAPSKGDSSDGPVVRRRTRTRTRRRGTDAPPSDAPATETAPRGRRTRDRTEGGQDPSPRTHQRSKPKSDDAPTQPDTASGKDDEAPSSSRGRRSRGGRGRRSSSRGGRTEQTTTSTSPATAPAVDTETARGSGKPRIRRPLQVDHLP